MKYYIIAGEASGDLHGSNLMKQLKRSDPQAEIRFWGGDLMLQESSQIVTHYRETAFMGITDVLLNLRTIQQLFKRCKADILNFKPDALVLIDYPGFNLKMAQFAKQHGITTHYYISPKVWAWNTKRAWKIKACVDYLYSILPFEKAFYEPYKVNLTYVGNPICDAIANHQTLTDFTNQHQIQKPIIALLPGSRLSELKYLLPTMLDAVKGLDDYEIVVAGTSAIDDKVYQTLIGNRPVKLIKGATYDIILNAKAALVCSGTATLETALLNCPQVVCYKFGNISYWIGRLVIKVKYISLVNLILNKLAIPELIQTACEPSNIQKTLLPLLKDSPERLKMIQDYAALKIKVGGEGASAKTGQLIAERTLPTA